MIHAFIDEIVSTAPFLQYRTFRYKLQAGNISPTSYGKVTSKSICCWRSQGKQTMIIQWHFIEIGYKIATWKFK
jgi:hypothetical protein